MLFYFLSSLSQRLMVSEGYEGGRDIKFSLFPSQGLYSVDGYEWCDKGVSIIQERFQGPHPWTPATQTSLLLPAPLRTVVVMYLEGRTPLPASHAPKEPVSQADKFRADTSVPVSPGLDVLDCMA